MEENGATTATTDLALQLAELELELIQPQMAQKPMMRGKVGARALRVRPVSKEEVWAAVRAEVWVITRATSALHAELTELR